MHVLVPQSRFAEARGQLVQASELDPASGAIAVSRGIITFFQRDLEEATRELESVARLHPRYALVHLFLGQCYELEGDYTRSVYALERAVELADDGSEALAVLAHTLARYGRAEDAEEILTRLEERATKRYVSPVLLAQALIGLGRVEEALDRLEEAVRLRATDLIWLPVRPVYDALRSSPRFSAILDEIGLRP
jgi:serine/threonine-protein kinase